MIFTYIYDARIWPIIISTRTRMMSRYEMRDRTDLLLPGSQAELVQAVRSAMGPAKPLIVALMGGGVIDTSAVDELVDAVIWVGYLPRHTVCLHIIHNLETMHD